MKLIPLFFFNFARLSKAASWQRKADRTQWRRDPLSHPDIAVMSERQRADIYFNPEFVEAE
jgi:hypothetical protein